MPFRYNSICINNRIQNKNIINHSSRPKVVQISRFYYFLFRQHVKIISCHIILVFLFLYSDLISQATGPLKFSNGSVLYCIVLIFGISTGIATSSETHLHIYVISTMMCHFKFSLCQPLLPDL